MFWTDNGREYVNKDVQAVVNECGIQHMTTPPYHVQANPVARVNRNIKMMIMSQVVFLREIFFFTSDYSDETYSRPPRGQHYKELQ